MTEQAEIQALYAKAKQKLAKANFKVEQAHAQIRMVQARCQHPHAFKTSHTGEPCNHCPDCGNCP